MDIRYIYHKRHDSAFYILASGAIVLTMVLSSNAMCRFTSSPCSHLYHLSMGSNKKYSTKCIVNGTDHSHKRQLKLTGNWIEPKHERIKFYSKAVSMIFIILISICLRSCMYWFGMISKKTRPSKITNIVYTGRLFVEVCCALYQTITDWEVWCPT